MFIFNGIRNILNILNILVAIDLCWPVKHIDGLK